MSLYLGARQLFLNRLGSKTLREIYFGNKLITGFTDADYSVDELIAEKAQAGEAPDIKAGNNILSVMSKNYNPGYAYSRYYCDHLKILMQYSGECIFYDRNGNEVINIRGTISFSYLSGKWTIGSKCIINGVTVFDQSNTQKDTPASLLTYEIYYNTSTRKWTVIWNGGTYTSSEVDWTPTYFRVRVEMWFISSTAGITTINGVIYLQNFNRGRGMPNART